MNNTKKAILALADGSIFKGESIGALGNTVGEVVFNTSMTGYQEIITDPSYAKQIITFTHPHIGNTGVNSLDWEAEEIHSSGVIIRDNSIICSSWRAENNFESFLTKNNIIGICNIDTRALTNILREKGAQNACIMSGNINEQEAVKLAKGFTGLDNLDLAKQVCCKKTYVYNNKQEWLLTDNNYPENKKFNKHIVVYDFGVKKNILRKFAQRNVKLTIVPAKTPLEEVLKLNPDGIFLSNGPGDPKACEYAVSTTKEILNLDKPIPVFGICLGMQVLALAANAKTKKMKFGHHGANHPVSDIKTKKVYITSQNHGFAVDEASLPNNLEVTHKSLFDNSLQGIKLTNYPAFGFQGHPEASPGPQDIDYLFDDFIDLINATK